MSLSFYISPNDISNNNILFNYQDNNYNWINNATDGFEDTTTDTSTTLLDKSYGNVKFGLNMIWNIFASGWTIPDKCTECPEIEQTMTAWFYYMSLLINLLLIFEAILLIYTKKNT